MLKLDPYQIIISPILTEKAVRLIKQGRYVFKVHPKASKTDIKQAIEKIFEVKVEKVNTINIPSKTKSYRFRYKYNRPSYKKAIVTLKQGFRINQIDSSIEKER
ncbi:MAG: 50S ribosomal protein L23 [bacterium]